jgi:hypothetical protein
MKKSDKEKLEEFIPKNPNLKAWTVTQRFTASEVEMLDAYAEKISEVTGVTVKRSWVIRKLLELGQKALESQYGMKVKDLNKGTAKK